MVRSTLVAFAIISTALAGCSGLPDMDSFNRFDVSAFRPRSVASLRDETVRDATSADFVDAQGACAAAPVAEGEAGAATGGVALKMTECEVVARLGAPGRVEIGQNERSERRARLTYAAGVRPGVYEFTGGRLSTIERTAEAAPARPAARPQRQAPPPRRQQPS